MDKTARKTRSHKQVGMTPVHNVGLLVIVGLLVCPVTKGGNRNIPAPEFKEDFDLGYEQSSYPSVRQERWTAN